MNRERFGISKWEGVALLISGICTKIFLNFPRVMAEVAGSAGWILVVYVSGLALLGFILIAKLYSRFKDKDLLDIAQKIGGNVGRIITGSIIIIFLIYIVAVVLREFAESIKIAGMTFSPISFVIFFILAGAIVAAYMGIEVIARTQLILVSIISVVFILILIAVYDRYDISNVQPILGNGIGAIFGKGFLKISVYAELLLLFLIVPSLKDPKDFKSIGYISIGVSAFFMLIGTLAFTSIYPYPTSLEGFMHVYDITRMIEFGSFFQRLEAAFLFIWMFAALMYLSFGVYFIAYIFKKTFKLNFYKPLIFPFAILIFNLSLLPSSMPAAIEMETKYFRSWAWVVTFGMTIVLLLTARIKKSVKNKKGAG